MHLYNKENLYHVEKVTHGFIGSSSIASREIYSLKDYGEKNYHLFAGLHSGARLTTLINHQNSVLF